MLATAACAWLTGTACVPIAKTAVGGLGGDADGSQIDSASRSESTVSDVAQLRADTNRDGEVDMSTPLAENRDEQNEDSATAIFLPNLDDDADRCRPLHPSGAEKDESELAR